MGREEQDSVSGRCFRRVKKGSEEEERDRMRGNKGGGGGGVLPGKERGIEVWSGFLLVAFSPD